MSELHLTARFTIQPGKSDAFRSIASKCIEAVRANEMDKGCSRYDWYYNDDFSICDVLETYSGNEAIFEHMNNVGPHLQELMAISEFSGSIYGDPSDAVKSAMEGMDVVFLSLEAGA
jgi:quinol monooxygenase YgiN